MMAAVLPAYFITFHTCGTWLHGDLRGSVDREHNVPRTPFLPADEALRRRDATKLARPAVRLGGEARRIVHRTILEVCRHRDWTLHALNVRTTHVHAVVSAGPPPERVMNDLKAWCTRRLMAAGLHERARHIWARHGSTKWLNTRAALDRACRYTLDGQGPDLM